MVNIMHVACCICTSAYSLQQLCIADHDCIGFIAVRRLLVLSLLLLFFVLAACLRYMRTTAILTFMLLVSMSCTISGVLSITVTVSIAHELATADVLVATAAVNSTDYCSTVLSRSTSTNTAVEFALFQSFPIASSACCYSFST
jgi:hypothetical protein